MNDIPNLEDLLTLNILLYYIDFVDGNIIGELARQSVQKYDTIVKLLRYKIHIYYMSNINAECRGFTKLIVHYCSRWLILLSGVCAHMSALSCKKVSKAYTVISFVNLPY